MAALYASRLGIRPSPSRPATKPDVTGTLEGLEGLPAEMLLDIYRQLDIESVFLLAQTNSLFHGLLRRNKPQIILPILQREFSPFEELLQVYTASEEDLNYLGDTFQPRRIIYRRFPGDVTGIVLCRGGMATHGTPVTPGFSEVHDRGKPTSTASLPRPRTIALMERDLSPLLRYCKTVRKWEELYPRLHWIAEPENCRVLGSFEKEKLRRALCRWWLHARYFHGDHPRPRRGEPEPFVHDIRTSQMRVYPTSQLAELRALVMSVKNLIRHYIYPNLEQNMDEMDDSTALERMIERSIRDRIVDTYAKLDPGELMFYFENLYNYPRKRLVVDVNLRHPTFVHDQESLLSAIQAAVEERHWLDGIGQLEDLGAIVGNASAGDERLNEDGNPDASIPVPGVFRRPQYDWSPPGDDGRALTERVHTMSGGRL
ncbi:hypothetical protein SODALDRAFT_272554 [Sodiomyces alkalinus F11]|uniref:F-box domain-containing protein n=1 Tax=Sodiomyces alkalinus (strain CBS 110278 / VKM F-3762 / F11) TaxID=1314773 RepID=A0A3N2Q0H4_SODAK|nr:hypothetical protein SODALDRAFT_272554 [Sodiomyces alkalinus F11]ROT40240.1 hypothetical protein SODALDRAFT_272554 [Sodiomyces alkalinus F11]